MSEPQIVEEVVEGVGYTVAPLDALGEGYGFRKIRRALGVEAFGVNALVLPPRYEAHPHFHDEQEELYFVHAGLIELEFGDGTVHPTFVSFGSVNVADTSSGQTITLTNSGAVSATGLTYASSHGAEFPVTSTCGSTLGFAAGGNTCTITIGYRPSDAGTDSATYRITGANNVNVTISLTGTGVVTAPDPQAAATAIAFEYYHQAFDHYFVTAIGDEITKLDNGTFVGWARTGRSFKVYPNAAAGLNAVCRFFSVAFAPKRSHLYTPDPPECVTVKDKSGRLFEGDVFYTPRPAPDGTCPAGTRPIYRMYNDGLGGAPNHRYTTGLAVRCEMWRSAGSRRATEIGVIMCAP